MRRGRLFPLALAALLLLSGCRAQGGTARTATFFAMDTVMEVTLYGDEALTAQVEAQITALERRLSVTDENSAVYALNRDGAATLDGETAALLEAGLALCRRTDGALDLSIYPVVRAWGFTTGDYRIPPAAELAALCAKVDYRQIAFDAENRRVTLAPGMQIDLGSIAKGWAGDRALELLRENGVRSALLNLGGNVQTLGTKPDGSLWRIGVRDPQGEGTLGVVCVADRAVVTSGGYERCFEQDGSVWWHIMDPVTGAPARSGLLSVTVVGESGTLCDGLSTALFVMGAERAAALWRASDDFEAILVADDGSVTITEGLQDCFTLSGEYENAPLTVLRRGEDE